ncbi:MAG TPA: GH1 family beta-glucosidase [Symbiobacteriaceae bacterium]|nr:GH1 family beta-glucosidase [Symbiobacteriaceae bacterium]
MQFPKGFLWGSATASYQIEGAVHEDGRGESIWDRFSHTPGKVWNGDTGDVACDHYHRYAEDVEMMADLGLQTYRFSIAWPRIMPTGEGRVNQKGLDFYKRLVDKLNGRGIMPAATLYHWDLPMALQYKGGWANRETAYRFAEYAEVVYRALADTVPLWITLNEPWCSSFLSHGIGDHAPGYTDWPMAVRTSHHLLLGHGLAVDAFRSIAPRTGQIGITLNMNYVYPATDSPADVAAARISDGLQNRWFAEPVFKGAYPADMLELFGRWESLDYMLPGDLAVISRPTDFLGINYYTRAVVKADAADTILGCGGVPPTAPLTDMGWEITPDALCDLLVRIKRDFTDLPIYITENGAAFPDRVEADGRVEDHDRIAFLQDHFAATHRALAAGVDVRGFYVWSLMDNFEWAFGYTKRFGIVHVDYETQQRRPKRSALWLRDVIRRNGLQT